MQGLHAVEQTSIIAAFFEAATTNRVAREVESMSFNTMSIAKARAYVERAREKMAKIREHAEEAIGQGIQIAEVSGTAFGFGYANARWGGEKGQVEILGLPADLGVAVALHGVAFMGGLGRYAEHGHNVGTGALASYSYRMGTHFGAEAGKLAPKKASPTNYVPAAAPGAFNGAPQHAVAGYANGIPYTVQHADAE